MKQMEKLKLSNINYNIFFVIQIITLVLYFKYTPNNIWEIYCLYLIFFCVSVYLILKINKSLFITYIIFFSFIIPYFLSNIVEFINLNSLIKNDYSSNILNHYFYKYAFFLNENYNFVIYKSFLTTIISMNFFFFRF